MILMEQIDNQADVVVIGGGIAGCATAYNLAKRGVSVVLLEKGEIADEQSGRNWGWVSQMRSPVEAPLHVLSHQRWATLSDELNADLEWVGWTMMAVDAVDQRSRHIETLDEIERTSVDYYAAIRSLYRQMRHDSIHNGEATDDNPFAGDSHPFVDDDELSNVN